MNSRRVGVFTVEEQTASATAFWKSQNPMNGLLPGRWWAPWRSAKAIGGRISI